MVYSHYVFHFNHARKSRCYHDEPKQLRRAALLLSAAANVAVGSHPKPMSSAAIGSSMATKSFMRSSAATIHVHADRAAVFKKCCMRTGYYDGVLRDVYF